MFCGDPRARATEISRLEALRRRVFGPEKRPGALGEVARSAGQIAAAPGLFALPTGIRRDGGCKKSRAGYVATAMATSFPVDRSQHEDEVWAWLEPHFRQHRRPLYLFALGALGNREDAEDATQIVLLNAHRALVRGARPTWPRAWLFAIALNVCRRLRRQASARRVLAAGSRELPSVQRGSDPSTGAEISRAVSSLPPGQREIFLLRELRGLSYAELSEKLGLSLAATESLLARARRRLREELAASDESTGLRSPRRRPLMGVPGAG